MSTWGKVFCGGRNEQELEDQLTILRKSGQYPIVECPMDLVDHNYNPEVFT